MERKFTLRSSICILWTLSLLPAVHMWAFRQLQQREACRIMHRSSLLTRSSRQQSQWVSNAQRLQPAMRTYHSSTRIWQANRKGFLSLDDLDASERVYKTTSDEDDETSAAAYYDFSADIGDVDPSVIDSSPDYVTSPAPAPISTKAKAEKPKDVAIADAVEKKPSQVASTPSNSKSKSTAKSDLKKDGIELPYEDTDSVIPNTAKSVRTMNRRDMIPPGYVHPAMMPESRTGTTSRTPKGLSSKPSGTTNDEYELNIVEKEMEKMIQEIYKSYNGEPFNVNSNQQVAMAVFGDKTQPANKAALDAIAHHNKVARQILEYRTLKAKQKRLAKKQKNRATGTQVGSIMTQTKLAQTKADTQKTSTSGSTSASKSDDGEKDGVQRKVVRSADPLILVDTSAYIFRAYFSMPPMHRDDGMPIGAVLGFCNMLNKLLMARMLNGEQPRLILVLDSPGPTFRHEMYPLYKAQRPEAPVDLVPQFQLVRDAAEAYGIPQIEAPGYEADDVIATLATKATANGINVNILSGDKDLMQLITEENDDDTQGVCQMIDPMSMTRVDHQAVIEKWGVDASKLGDILALAGDKADNIPGVPGIGPKIAAQLINEYGSLDSIYDNVEDIKQTKRREKLVDSEEQARLSRKLVELERDVLFKDMKRLKGEKVMDDEELEGLRMDVMDVGKIVQFYDDMGFTNIKYNFLSKVKIANAGKKKKLAKTSKIIDAAAADDDDDPYATSLPATDLGNQDEAKDVSIFGAGFQPDEEFEMPKQIITVPPTKKPRKSRKKAGVPKPEDYENVPF